MREIITQAGEYHSHNTHRLDEDELTNLLLGLREIQDDLEDLELMNKIKVMTIVGTRPEIIKLSEVMKELDRHVNHTIVHTGQNYDYELNRGFF